MSHFPIYLFFVIGGRAPQKVACIDVNKVACPRYKKYCKNANVRSYCCKTCSGGVKQKRKTSISYINASRNKLITRRRYVTQINSNRSNRKQNKKKNHENSSRRQFVETKRRNGIAKSKTRIFKNPVVGMQESM